ncbi:MAG TPA: TonB-dependent receptor plug domain-containing protein [Opitutaceae bacterium]|nr:TonB-dependent receptor plug domain-containing protein [Opitutaceae bacterium]
MKLPNVPANHTPARVLRLAMAAALSLSLIRVGLAQSNTVSTASADQSSTVTSEEIVKLSPFVVDASKDVGYRATSTLAGSRINTDLKDVAAPIQVVTKEFLTDINAVDINDVLAYTANTEGTRTFTSSTMNLGRPSDDVAGNPQGTTRLRGLAAPDITRDYFYTIGSYVGFDTYNLDQVTVDLGPNSLLAGLGSPGGIINYSPQFASLGKNTNELSYRFGSWGDQRATFNSNVVVKDNALAVRLAGMWSDRGYKQQPAYDHDKRLYLAATYKPWSKTTIRANYEIVKQAQRHPNTITPEDDVTPWLQAGSPTYDRTSPQPGSYGNAIWWFGDQNLFTTMYSANGQRERAFNLNTGYTYSQMQPSNVGIWAPLRMHNNQYIDLADKNLNPSVYNSRLDTLEVSIDQEILPHLDFNAAYEHEHFTSDYITLFRAEYASYYVDVDTLLPDGAANPHFGETFMTFRGLDNLQRDDNTNRVGRATLTYELDLNKTNKWLGRYRVTGFLEDRRTEKDHIQYNSKRSDAAYYSGGFTETGNRYYLGGTAANGFIATAVPQTPVLVNNVPAIDIVSGSAVHDTMSSFWWTKSVQKSLTKLSSSAFVLQAYLLEDRIVPMLGIRRDSQDQAFASAVDPDQVSSSTGLLNPVGPYPPFTSFALQTKSYGVVVHPYPIKWLSFHYSHAENFNPTSVGKIDLLGAAQPSPHGVSKDYGFSVDLFDGKLNAKFNWFELKAENGDAASVTFPLSQWTVPFMDLIVMPELAAKAGVAYTPGVASGISVGDSRLGGYTSDQVSKGMEVTLTYNVTRNWRVMGTLAKQEAKQSNIASKLTAFINSRLAYWQSLAGGRLWNDDIRTSNNPWGVVQNGQEHWNQFDLPYFVAYQAYDGQPSQQLAKWHASALTNYTFDTGPLKGFNAGLGGRYIDKQIIGNPAVYAGGTVVGLDLAHPYTAGGYVAIDAWVGYTMKLAKGKYLLNIQLNGQDLQEKGGFRPILANSDGTHAAFKIVQPRTYYVTVKLDF